MRDYVIILLFLCLLGGTFTLVQRCHNEAEVQAYKATAADSAELAAFEEEILQDSLRTEEERAARYDSLLQVWSSERQERWATALERYKKSPEGRAYQRDQERWDSVRRARKPKLKEGTILNLNTVDSLILIQVHLIGPARAGQILSYRRQLGGYVSVQQLLEINAMAPEVLQFFMVSPDAEITRLRINSDSFRTLVRHPYLSFDQVKEISKYRQKFGKIRSWEDLSLSPFFAPHDFERLTPYISFE